jgi:hypothetical protein
MRPQVSRKLGLVSRHPDRRLRNELAWQGRLPPVHEVERRERGASERAGAVGERDAVDVIVPASVVRVNHGHERGAEHAVHPLGRAIGAWHVGHRADAANTEEAHHLVEDGVKLRTVVRGDHRRNAMAADNGAEESASDSGGLFVVQGDELDPARHGVNDRQHIASARSGGDTSVPEVGMDPLEGVPSKVGAAQPEGSKTRLRLQAVDTAVHHASSVRPHAAPEVAPAEQAIEFGETDVSAENRSVGLEKEGLTHGRQDDQLQDVRVREGRDDSHVM